MKFSRQALAWVLLGSISALGGCGGNGSETTADALAPGTMDGPAPRLPDGGSSPETGAQPTPDGGAPVNQDVGAPGPDAASPSPDVGSVGDVASNGMTQALITAAAGGKVSLGSLRADFPAGALAADTTITVRSVDVSTLPEASSIISAVYDLGPDGTTFAKPVELNFEFDNSKLVAGEVAHIAFVKGSTWERLADSQAKNGKITATTTHFTMFGVVKSKATTMPVAGCPAAGVYTLISFKCGAMDITSVWKSIIPSSTLTFSSQGPSCKMVITNTADACKETREETFVFGAQGSHTVAGVTSCNPAGCKFNANDAPCVVGDDAKPATTGNVPGFEVVNGQITIVTPANSGGLCGVTEGVQVFDINPAATVTPPPSKLTDNGNGTVSDAGTKLTWQKAVESTPMAWADAETLCKGLTLAGGGWRLPTLTELKSLVKTGQNPAIDATFFPNTPGAKFWTSNPNGTKQHWYVDFQNGLENAGSASDGLVRCVR
ncbi:MAG TPA: DUF1566 domain-containing protein [Polyangia bacterium]